MKLLIYPAVEDARLQKIVAAAKGVSVIQAENEGHAIAAIADCEILFGKLTPKMLAQANQLRWVQAATASLEHYVFPELVAHPVVLTNMRGLYSDVIADHVMGYVTMFARNLHLYLRQQIERRWEPIGGEGGRSDFLSGPGIVSSMDRAHLHLADCSMGIVGLGHIGREIARRALSFGMEVSAVDPTPLEIPPGVRQVQGLDKLPDLLALSDFVVVAAPHTPVTQGMFRRGQFQQMKRSAYFINIGRGAIVSLGDLNAALDAGEIAGAALDVFEQEPLPKENPLWGRHNVILTPHVAACSPRIAERHLATLLRNIELYLRGEPLENVVNKAQWY